MKITISGIGGVGKGTTAKILAEHLGYKTKSGGDFFRKMAKDLNMTLYKFDQFVKDNPEYDYKLDEMQKKFGKKNNNFVLESRLG
ncbi:MAG: AAA family ATPase [Candidatus Pacebacteria bacterium]|nr:AAA family ATPase [Candidatus Paceibacterota bacterium]